jgi:hypothetical protein
MPLPINSRLRADPAVVNKTMYAGILYFYRASPRPQGVYLGASRSHDVRGMEVSVQCIVSTM